MKFEPKPLIYTDDASRGRVSFKGFLKNLVSVLVVLAVIYLVLGFAADLIASYLPDEWEAKVSGNLLEKSDELYCKAEAERCQNAKTIFTKLLEQPLKRKLSYRIVFLDSDEPNAFALPGGFVMLTTGLLDQVEQRNALAFVIAHELGHHYYRHTLKRAGRALLYQLVTALIFQDSSNQLLSGAHQLEELNYSRKQEEEADLFGLKLVKSAFGEVDHSLDFFDIVLKRERKSAMPSRWFAFLSTHPNTEQRLNTLQTYIKNNSY